MEMGDMRNGHRLKRYGLALALTLAIFPQVAQAGDIVGVVLSGGAALTSGSLGHKSDLGYTGTFSIAVKPDPTSSPELSLLVRLGWTSFPTDTGEDFVIITGELDLKLDGVLSRSPNMYLVGGGGLAKTDFAFTETSPFLSVGIGLESGHLVLESRLVRLFGEQIQETTFFPVTIGLRF